MKLPDFLKFRPGDAMNLGNHPNSRFSESIRFRYSREIRKNARIAKITVAIAVKYKKSRIENTGTAENRASTSTTPTIPEEISNPNFFRIDFLKYLSPSARFRQKPRTKIASRKNTSNGYPSKKSPPGFLSKKYSDDANCEKSNMKKMKKPQKF